MTEIPENDDIYKPEEINEEQQKFISEIKSRLSKARQSGILNLSVLDEISIEVDTLALEMNQEFGQSDYEEGS